MSWFGCCYGILMALASQTFFNYRAPNEVVGLNLKNNG